MNSRLRRPKPPSESKSAAKATAPAEETTVFLSSTFRDLESHRATLKLALESSGYQVSGIELFTASVNPSLDTCLSKLDKSHIYIGIIGEYYGSSPPGFKKSYTQLEYIEAAKRKMPMFLFLTADDAEVTPAQIEKDAQKRERLNAFKSELKKNHTIAFFKNAHQAAWQILAALRMHEIQKREKGQT